MSGPSLQALLSHFLGDEDDNSDRGRGFQDFIQNDFFFIFFPVPGTKQNPTAK